MKKLLVILGVFSALGLAVKSAKAVTCTSTGFYRDGINMTAAQIGGDVTGTLDAIGCNIGVYYDASTPAGDVYGAEIYGANYFGVVVRGTDVDVTGTHVHDIGETPFNGAQHGIGVYYATVDTGSPAAQPACTSGKTSGKVWDNTIELYQKGGFVANCEGTKVDVKGNDILGLDSVPFIAQNGIQFGYGGTGNAMENYVNGNWYTGANWSSTGILLFETDNVNAHSNNVVDNQVGIAVESWCWFRQSANTNTLVKNTVEGSDYGVSVMVVDFPGYSMCDPKANNNKVVNNTLTSLAGIEGVFVGVADFGAYEPEADNNKVISNSISGFLTPVADGGTSSKVHANVVGP